MSNWVLDIPIQYLIEVVHCAQNPSLADTLNGLEKPVVLIYGNEESSGAGDDIEHLVYGFESKEEAKKFIEENNSTGNLELEGAFINGKQVRWTERKIFDFMEVKK